MPQIDSIRIRRGTAAAWVSANPTLELGEFGLETDAGRVKYGDGLTAWASLPYFASQGKVLAKTGNYTMIAEDRGILVDASGGAVTITLKTAASMSGREVWIKKTDSSGNAVTIDANGSETIDDSTTVSVTTQYESVTMYSDGTEWWII